MNQNDIKITVFGIGGIGGILGGALAYKFPENVNFIARGQRLDHLKKYGLTVNSDYLGEFVAKPKYITENPEEIGISDVLILSVKNNNLTDSTIKEIKPLIGKNTIVVVAMNGLTALETLNEKLDVGLVCGSIVFVVAFSNKDFSVSQKGKFIQLVMDSMNGNENIKTLNEMFIEAGITSRLSDNIKVDMWNKYAFNCSFNTMTAALACTTKGVKEKISDFANIISECVAVAKAEGIILPIGTVEAAVKRLNSTDDSSSSSLSRDFDKKIVGEMDVFSKDLIDRARKYKVRTPTMDKYYELLRNRAESFK